MAGTNATTRPQKKKQPTALIKVDDSNIVGHPILANQDGYAHGLYIGRMFLSDQYNKHDRERYAAGFRAGQRVRNVLGAPRTGTGG